MHRIINHLEASDFYKGVAIVDYRMKKSFVTIASFFNALFVYLIGLWLLQAKESLAKKEK